MDFSITPDDRLLQQSVRDFIEDKANAVWQEIEKTDALPQHLIDGARDVGLLGLSIPQEYGGLGLSVVQKTLCHEQLGRGPWGLASFISVHTGIGCVGIVRFGNAEQKQRYLPKMATGEWIGAFALTEPQSGSDAAALATRAERKGDSYLVTGRKIFITNAPRAHHFVTFARTAAGISAFIIDADSPGVSIGQVFDTTGHKGSADSEVVFEDARIPAESLIGEEGKGMDYAKRRFSEGRTTSARCVGTAQKALEPLSSTPSSARPRQAADRALLGCWPSRPARSCARNWKSAPAASLAWRPDQAPCSIRESSTSARSSPAMPW
ncbi:MAG: acyl-CoA dehydrogenase family protein [Candidatus Binatia bacterium]